MSTVDFLNSLEDPALQAALTKCCASKQWVERMMRSRPFTSDSDLHQHAAECWNTLERADWLEAFAAHPKIGDISSLRAKYVDTGKWASGEQAGVTGANDDTLRRLADGNREYEAKFGYIFIVCATGKSADEMLAILEQRLLNEAAAELEIAAAEQLKITNLRLSKLAS
jgi:OHCU decarboxylase